MNKLFFTNNTVFAKLWCLVVGALVLSSCNEKKEFDFSTSELTMEVKSNTEAVYYGDSLLFAVEVSDNLRSLKSLTAQLYFGETLVAQRIVSTTENGEYTGRLYVPFESNAPNREGTLQFVLENERGKEIHQSFNVMISRPDYSHLRLVTTHGEYRMERVGLYQYEVTENFPVEVEGYIKTPKYGTNGNELTFGWINNAVDLGSTDFIPFFNYKGSPYSISFNTLTYEASPFESFGKTISSTDFTPVTDSRYPANTRTRLEAEFTQGEPIDFFGFDSDMWVNSDFFASDGKGGLEFNAMTGKYRITADHTLRYFEVEVMDGNNLAVLGANGAGAIRAVSGGMGHPSYIKNNIANSTVKAVSFAPLGGGRHQLTIVSGQTVQTPFSAFNISGTYVDFSIIFRNTGSPGRSITTTSPFVSINNTNGNFTPGSQPMIAGKKYMFTIDLSAGNGNGVLTVAELP